MFLALGVGSVLGWVVLLTVSPYQHKENGSHIPKLAFTYVVKEKTGD